MISIGRVEHVYNASPSRKRTDETWATTRAPLSVIWFTGVPITLFEWRKRNEWDIIWRMRARTRIKIIQNRTQILHYHDDVKWWLGSMENLLLELCYLCLKLGGNQLITSQESHLYATCLLKHVLYVRHARYHPDNEIFYTRVLSSHSNPKRVGGYLAFFVRYS